MKTIAQQLNIKDFPFEIDDKDGNEIYCESSDGYWYKREWKDGNEIYFENSNGYWMKKEYKDGLEVYYKSSYGSWWKKEYENGNEIYHENSDGKIIDNRPKERPCVGKKVTIDGVEYELKQIIMDQFDNDFEKYTEKSDRVFLFTFIAAVLAIVIILLVGICYS